MSLRIHSTRVADRMAQRSSRWSPSERRPAAMARARAPASFHVIVFQPPTVGYWKASESGVEEMRWSHISGTERNDVLAAMESSPEWPSL
jgi:hypothetical protein